MPASLSERKERVYSLTLVAMKNLFFKVRLCILVCRLTVWNIGLQYCRLMVALKRLLGRTKK
jgi:hypothetical protein